MLSLVVAAASLVWLLPLVRNELVVEDSSIAGDEAGNLRTAIPDSHLGLERNASSRLSQDNAGALRVAALTRILQELPEETSRVSAAQQEALAAQMETEFGEFLATLAADPQRAAAARANMLQALTEIAQISAALQSGQLTPMQLVAITDPNHVLNRVSGLLEPEEITALEDQIDSRAHNEYLRVVNPQVETMAPGLTPENRELLLQTFYAESSEASMPFGIGVLVGPGANLDL